MKGWGSKILDNRIMVWNWDNKGEFAVSVVVGGIDCETKSKTKNKAKQMNRFGNLLRKMRVSVGGRRPNRANWSIQNSYTFNIIITADQQVSDEDNVWNAFLCMYVWQRYDDYIFIWDKKKGLRWYIWMDGCIDEWMVGWFDWFDAN